MKSNVTAQVTLKGLIIALIVCLPVSLLAQQYVEASGQTFAFDLKAGAKAGWDKSASGVIRAIRIGQAHPLISIKRQHNGNQYLTIAGDVPANSRIIIYSLDGRTRMAKTLSTDHEIMLTGRMQAGFYIARIISGSSILSTFHFLETR